MKKYAFIIMGSFDTERDQAIFKTTHVEHYIYSVKNFNDAKNLIKKLTQEKFGAIELCGDFGKEKALELFALTDKKIPISYVIAEPEQQELVQKFWTNK